MKQSFTVALGIAALAITAGAHAETLTGKPRVIDADTVVIAGQRIRLDAIDAPESAQQCENAKGQRYPCGKQAGDALRRLIGNQPITCKAAKRDRYNRLLGICTLNGMDINGQLVRSGLAIAYRQYSRAYIRHEEEARKQRRGIWAGRFVKPWDWRKGKRLPGEPKASR